MDKQESKMSPLHFGNMQWEPKNVAIASIEKGEELEVVPKMQVSYDTNTDMRVHPPATEEEQKLIDIFGEEVENAVMKRLRDGEISRDAGGLYVPESFKRYAREKAREINREMALASKVVHPFFGRLPDLPADLSEATAQQVEDFTQFLVQQSDNNAERETAQYTGCFTSPDLPAHTRRMLNEAVNTLMEKRPDLVDFSQFVKVVGEQFIIQVPVHLLPNTNGLEFTISRGQEVKARYVHITAIHRKKVGKYAKRIGKRQPLLYVLWATRTMIPDLCRTTRKLNG